MKSRMGTSLAIATWPSLIAMTISDSSHETYWGLASLSAVQTRQTKSFALVVAANLSPPRTANVRQTDSWSKPRMLTQNRPLAAIREDSPQQLIVIDLALTHDFDPAVGSLDGVELITLESVRLAAPQEQAESLAQASTIVAGAAEAFAGAMKELRPLVEGELPTFNGAQAAGCNPVAAATPAAPAVPAAAVPAAAVAVPPRSIRRRHLRHRPRCASTATACTSALAKI